MLNIEILQAKISNHSAVLIRFVKLFPIINGLQKETSIKLRPENIGILKSCIRN